jgi:hypothetical protein
MSPFLRPWRTLLSLISRTAVVERALRAASLAVLLLLIAAVPEASGSLEPAAATRLAHGAQRAALTSGSRQPVRSAQASDALVPGPITLTTTFNSIGVEAPFGGDANGNSTAELSFRRVGEGVWRTGLPLWRTAHPSGAAFYGSALLLDAGAEYEVRVAFDDQDGVESDSEQIGTISTRADAIALAESLGPTHFVRADGDDDRDGRSPATSWRTLDRAIRAAPSGAVVQVGPGYYSVPGRAAQPPPAPRTRPLTLVAEYPAVGDDRRPINDGRRSVVEPNGVSSPAGATDGPNPGVWRQVSLTGPRTGQVYTVWSWAGSPAGDAMQLGYAESRAATPRRVAHWVKDKADLATPAGWAEKLYTNLTYNYGFYADGADLYLRLPGDLDPNGLYVTASEASQAGLAVNGADVRVSGFEVRQFTSGVNILGRAQGAVVDHCLLSGNATGVAFRADRRAPDEAGQPNVTYGGDHVVQDNLILDSSLRSDGSPETLVGSMIPWMFIKSKIREADGSEYATNRIGGQSETNGVGGRGGAQRVVVRRNTVDGPFDGVGTGYNEGYDRYAAQDMDVYDNLIRHVADDALEPELSTINFRAWNNRIDEALTVLSTGPVSFGPVYLFRNAATRIGNDGTPPDGQGRVPGSTMFKYSGKSDPPARIYVLHNTFWTDRSADGGAQFAASGPSPEAFYLRNNLIRSARYAFEAPRAAGAWDEDYNYFVTTDPGRGLSYSNTTYRSNVQAYRDASGQGAHTNVAADFTVDVQLMNPSGGDLRLPADSPLVDAGVPVPNLSDQPELDYHGAAPDIGYQER